MTLFDSINTLLRENIAASTLVFAIVAAGGALIAFIGLTSIKRVSLADEANRVNGLREPSFIEQLQLRLDQSGIHVRALEFVTVSAMLGIGAAAVMLLARLYAMALIALLVAPFLYYQMLMSRRDMRLREFREQLPDAIDDFKEFYKSGNVVIDTAVAQMALHAPLLLRREFEKVEMLASQLPGNAMQEALRQVGRSRSEPFFRQFMDALATNKAKGGPLEQILDRIARAQRTQLSLQNQIRSQQAGGRIVGLVYGIAPPCFLVLLKVGGGMFSDFYESLPGQLLQVMAVAAGAFAYWAVLKVGRRGVYVDEIVAARLDPDQHADLLDLRNYSAEDEKPGRAYSPASHGNGAGADAAKGYGATGFTAAASAHAVEWGAAYGKPASEDNNEDDDEDNWLPMSSLKPTLQNEEGDHVR